MSTFLDTRDPGFETAFARLMQTRVAAGASVDTVVRDIIADVRTRGLDAVLDLTHRFDHLELTPDTVVVGPAEIEAAIATVPHAKREALELAAERIR
ncbi:MAG: histidinol dehydrogenase, partial [Pseudomonadota bacterium]